MTAASHRRRKKNRLQMYRGPRKPRLATSLVKRKFFSNLMTSPLDPLIRQTLKPKRKFKKESA